MTDFNNKHSTQKRTIAAKTIARNLQPLAKKFLIKQRENDTKRLEDIEQSRKFSFRVCNNIHTPTEYFNIMLFKAGATHTHSSNSASLMAFQENYDKRGHLIPTGQLIKSGKVPMSGTLDLGVFDTNGINLEHLSMYSIPILEYNPKETVTRYSNMKNIEFYTHEHIDWHINKLKTYVIKEKSSVDLDDFFKKLKDRFDYEEKNNLPNFARVLTEKIMYNTFYTPLEKLDEFLDKAINIADLRMKQYNAMSGTMKQFVDEPFPIAYGIKPTKSRKIISGLPDKEKGAKDGVSPWEIRAILVPQDKMDTVKQFIGEDFLKDKMIKIYSFEQAFPDKK